MVDGLLPDLAAVPLLLVLTAAGQGDPGRQPWLRWCEHGGTTHVDLPPLPVPSMVDLVEAWLPGVLRETAVSIGTACGGNPGVAREFCHWTGNPVDEVKSSALPWLSAAVATGEAVLAALDTVGEPTTTCLISESLGMPRAAVVEALDSFCGEGLVVRDHELDPRYRLAHPLVGHVARALAGAERINRINRRLAATLAARQITAPSATSVRIARHLLAACADGAETVRHCLDAAEWLSAEEEFEAAVVFATRGLAAEPDPERECRSSAGRRAGARSSPALTRSD